eukprot:TRINITY_DN4816_c0_g1_i1.p1 TRINITY_DN4816_c0_g1~~TRINITY_DN4816_c0_g1_i1.p1  ORF type:complete len:136 (+),score=17.92 TRINITY_DN4816_c0_g1_i1:97-504(+)
MVDSDPFLIVFYDVQPRREMAVDLNRYRPPHYIRANIFVLCFSMVDRKSFDNVKKIWYPEVRHYCPETLVMLAGTKCDLVTDSSTLHSLNQNNSSPITIEEGMNLAEEIGAVGFIPFSSLTRHNFELLFVLSVRA